MQSAEHACEVSLTYALLLISKTLSIWKTKKKTTFGIKLIHKPSICMNESMSRKIN